MHLILLPIFFVPILTVDECWSDLVPGGGTPGGAGPCWPGTTQCYKQIDSGNGGSTTLYGCDTINNCYGIDNGKCKTVDRGGGIKRKTCCCGENLCNSSTRFQPWLLGIFSVLLFLLKL